MPHEVLEGSSLDIQRMVETVRWIFGQVPYGFQPSRLLIFPNPVDSTRCPSAVTLNQVILTLAQLNIANPSFGGRHEDGSVSARSRGDIDDTCAL